MWGVLKWVDCENIHKCVSRLGYFSLYFIVTVGVVADTNSIVSVFSDLMHIFHFKKSYLRSVLREFGGILFLYLKKKKKLKLDKYISFFINIDSVLNIKSTTKVQKKVIVRWYNLTSFVINKIINDSHRFAFLTTTCFIINNYSLKVIKNLIR